MSTLKIKRENGKIFCPLADSWHIETPEEKVRQEYIKIIKDIIIQIDDDITVEQLSEGEKKLILVKTVLEILSDEKTLVLMDEPDAHLHEGRKPALCNMMREYPNRQIVIATHSPIMAQIANEKELLMLELENGKSTILTDEKIEKIKKLSGTSWDVIGQGMMLRSSRPLVVFEGKTDVMYVKRALEMLKSRVTDYASLNVDFLNANGAGNVKSFIDNLKSFVPDSKKIVVFFDRDNAGKDGVHAITGISKNDERVAHYQDILRTCHNIIRNNDKLSPEAAFDEISKILFMKIKYEREQRGAKVFTKNEFVEKEKWFEKEIRPSLKGTPKDLPYMQFLFYNTKEEFKADQLFEENEIIKIRQNSFEQILEKLETYNLSDTQDDVKGIAFEQFLGTTFRGELGQYFTPRTIVDFMTHILDPKENETVCDPTCGSGGFLIKAFEYMREKIEEDVKKAKSELRSVIEGENYDSLSEKEQVVINERIEAMQSTLNKELDTQVEGSRMYNLSRNCIYGTDANPRMARTSKMNMIMHGDGHGGVHHHDGLLNV